MVKPTTIRLPQDIKKALEVAAAVERRTQSSMIEKILADWLIEKNYLKPNLDEIVKGSYKVEERKAKRGKR